MTNQSPQDSANTTPPKRPDKTEPDDAVSKQGDADEMVLTPDGYRPKSQVHRVGADSAVRVNEDGSLSVVPKKVP